MNKLIEEAERKSRDFKDDNAYDYAQKKLIRRLVEALKEKESHTLLGEKDNRRAED